MYRLYRCQRVEQPLDNVFAFFERPENLERITPPHLRLHILTPSPIPMQVGTLIDYRIRLFGLPFRWTTYIARYEPPRLFVDVQLRGPYSFWHHTHRFTADGDGATIVEDEVLYLLPAGVVGKVVYALFIHRQLKEIFDYRAQVIAKLFAANVRSALAEK